MVNTYIYIYIYVWKLNQTVLELDFRAVKFLQDQVEKLIRIPVVCAAYKGVHTFE